MHFVLQTPSLQHLAGVKIVTDLWSEPDIFAKIEDSFCYDLFFNLFDEPEEWIEIEDKVIRKIWRLQIPKHCQLQLLNFIVPIGKEIIDWCEYHSMGTRDNFDYFDNLIPYQLCWTMHGSIDYVKMAELIVEDEYFSIKTRYAVACFNCLEDEARQLFREMGAAGRREYLHQLHENIYTPGVGNLIFYFCYTINGDVKGLKRHFDAPSVSSINKRLFKEAVGWAGGAVCEYFFEKLSPRNKKRALEAQLRGSFHHRDYPNCGWLYYLSLMNEEQQEYMFRNCFDNFLTCFLHWPMQPLFQKAAERGLPFLSQGDCEEVLNHILRIIFLEDYDYARLFWEFWRLDPAADYHRKFLSHIHHLVGLIETEEEELVKLVLNEAPSQQMSELLYRYYNKKMSLLLDERVSCDATLMKCKEAAVLESSNDKKDTEKRLRSKYLSQLVDEVLKRRIKNRKKRKIDCQLP